MATEDYITASEAATILGVHRVTINRWAKDGKLQAAQKLSGPLGAYLFDRAEVLRFTP